MLPALQNWMLQLGFKPKATSGQKKRDAEGGPTLATAVKAEVQPPAAASQPSTSVAGQDTAVSVPAQHLPQHMHVILRVP